MPSPDSPDRETLIGLGDINDHEVFSEFAYCADVDETSLKILSSNLAIEQPAAETQVTFVSDSVEDDLTKTGLEQLKMTYFNDTWVLKEEIIELNGTGAKDSVATDVYRIQEIDAIQRGSAGGAVGTITCKKKGAANLYAEIKPGRSIFERLLHYVPPGMIAVITDIFISATKTTGTKFVLIVTQDFTDDGGEKLSLGLAHALAAYGTGSVWMPNLPYVVDATGWTRGRTIAIAVQGIAADQDASASIRFYQYTP